MLTSLLVSLQLHLAIGCRNNGQGGVQLLVSFHWLRSSEESESESPAAASSSSLSSSSLMMGYPSSFFSSSSRFETCHKIMNYNVTCVLCVSSWKCNFPVTQSVHRSVGGWLVGRSRKALQLKMNLSWLHCFILPYLRLWNKKWVFCYGASR